MAFVVAARPPIEAWRDQDAQVLAEAEDVIVGILFDDIVRTLLRPPTPLVPKFVSAPSPSRERTGPPPVTAGRQRSGAAWARSPPYG